MVILLRGKEFIFRTPSSFRARRLDSADDLHTMNSDRGDSQAKTRHCVHTFIELSLSLIEEQVKTTKKRKSKRKPRLKKPYSNSTMLSCLLDLEYGNTNAHGVGQGDQEFHWDIAKYINVIDTEE